MPVDLAMWLQKATSAHSQADVEQVDYSLLLIISILNSIFYTHNLQRTPCTRRHSCIDFLLQYIAAY